MRSGKAEASTVGGRTPFFDPSASLWEERRAAIRVAATERAWTWAARGTRGEEGEWAAIEARMGRECALP
jgi:hypothetical protein